MKSRKFIIMIIERFTPITRFLSRLYQLPGTIRPAYPVALRYHTYPENVGAKVYVLRQSCYLSFRLDMSGPAHNHRHAERFFVHETLIKPTMFSQIEALIGSIDYNRIFIPVRYVSDNQESLPHFRLHSLQLPYNLASNAGISIPRLL